MALDIGEVRCGIAVSDPAMRIASPVCVLPTQEVLANASSFRRVVEDWEPELLLSGLPLSLSGEKGPQAQRIEEQAVRIAKALDLPLEVCDERLSSAEKRALREGGHSAKSMRATVDMIAASTFLYPWLDARH